MTELEKDFGFIKGMIGFSLDILNRTCSNCGEKAIYILRVSLKEHIVSTMGCQECMDCMNADGIKKTDVIGWVLEEIDIEVIN